MNKIAGFLIIVVLIARGALYIYDNNKNKIDSLVTPSHSATSETPLSTKPAASRSDAANTKVVSYTTLTFLLTAGDEIYYYVGPFNGILFTLDRNYAGTFIKAYKNNIPPDNLMILIKSDKSTTFGNVIDMLDEMTKNEVPAGHYAEAEITKEEMEKINKIKKTKNG
jgi:hypothetical protein